MLRNLRIAFSVACGIVCLLLIILWVRSYSWRDSIYRDPLPTASGELRDIVGIVSLHGNLIFTKYIDPFSEAGGWGVASYPIDADAEPVNGKLGFAWRHRPDSVYVTVPYWLPVLFWGILAAASWSKWHFSLRALLIATTLVALLLGILAITG